MNIKKTTGRRVFLKAAAAGTAAIALNPTIGKVLGESTGPTEPSPLNKWPGRVAINFNKAAVSDGNADATVIQKMVDQTIKLLTGKDDLGEAWKAIFPDSLSATSKIAVKVVCFNPYKAGLHWSVARAVTDGLMRMDINGKKFPAANIRIFEMNTSMITDAFQVAGYTKTNFPDIPNENIVDKKEPVDGGDGALENKPYAKTLKEADFLINCFNARGHALVSAAGSKFTLGFKSHYGTYTNPGPWDFKNYLHSNWDKNFRDIVCIGPVYKKLVLSVCGAIFGLNEGNGPGGLRPGDNNVDDFTTYAQQMDSTSTIKAPATVIMSTDPVSAEMQAIKILRINNKGNYAPSDMPAYLKASAGISVSGLAPTYNIGTIDESKMKICKMVNDTVISGPTAALSPTLAGRNTPAVSISALQIPGNGSVFIDYKLPENYVGREASIEIFDAKGTVVKIFSEKVWGINNNLSWDEKDLGGNAVTKGLYVVRLSCGSVRQASNFSVV